MPRVKRGNKRRLKRKKILRRAKGYYLAKSKLYRIAREQVQRSLAFAYRDRRQRKRQPERDENALLRPAACSAEDPGGLRLCGSLAKGRGSTLALPA